MHFGCKTNGIIYEAYLGTSIISGFISASIVIVNLMVFISAYREDRKFIARGLWRVMRKYKPAPLWAILGVVRLLGTVTIDAVFGFTLVAIVIFAGCNFLAFSTVLPILKIYKDWFWKDIVVDIFLWNSNGPGIITVFLIVYIVRILLARLMFQASTRVPAIRNRTYFSNLDMFWFVAYYLVFDILITGEIIQLKISILLPYLLRRSKIY